MIILQADNRQLVKNAKYSYLTTNYNSGVTAVVVKNSDIVDPTVAAADGMYALFGEFGSQQSELVLVSTVTTATHTLNLNSATVYAHPQDTKITIIRYNQVKFYQTAAATFDSNENYLGAVNIQAYRTHTIYQDTTNTTGYGWFVFSNSTTNTNTTNSNAIPYAGFESSSVKEIFDEFFSLLNNKEMKLVSHEDAFRWLNEGYNRAQNELNMINQEYGVEAEDSVTTISGTQEYDLQTATGSKFGSLISVTNADGDTIDFIKLSEVNKNDDDSTYSTTTVRYSIRNTKLVLSPTPTTTGDVFYFYYKKKTTSLSSYYDSIDFPNNNFYILIDFMLYRASAKLNRPNPKQYLESFMESINAMKVSSHKQNANLDSFSIDDYANV